MAITWYANASGFVPYWDAIRKDLFRNSWGRVQFADGKTGTLYLVANVTDPKIIETTGEIWVLTLYYARVPTEMPGVRAVLKAVHKKTGGITNLARAETEHGEVGTTLVSNVTKKFHHDFDFGKYFYYVVLELKRETVNTDPVAIGAEIGGAPD